MSGRARLEMFFEKALKEQPKGGLYLEAPLV